MTRNRDNPEWSKNRTEKMRRDAERVRRLITPALRTLGFVRTKTSWWVREKEHTAEFVHLHKYSGNAYFRIHIGLRILSSATDSVALNGPESSPDWKLPPVFGFGEDYMIDRCAQSIVSFVREIGEPWWDDRTPQIVLRRGPTTEFREAEIDALLDALAGSTNAEAIANSRVQLGLAKR